MDTEERIQEALNTATQMPTEIAVADVDYDADIESFVDNDCGCTLHNGQACSTRFAYSHIKRVRYAAMELNRSELDLIVIGQLAATVSIHDSKRSYTSFLHSGQRVCKKTFLFLHGIGEKRLKNITKHYLQNGYVGRTHGNTRRKPRHALSLDCIKYIVSFILNYSEMHGLVLPGRVPGYSRSDIQLLPHRLPSDTFGISTVQLLLQPAIAQLHTRLSAFSGVH